MPMGKGMTLDKEVGPSIEDRIPFLKLFSLNLSRCGIHHLSKESKVIRYALYKSLEGKEVQLGSKEKTSKGK